MLLSVGANISYFLFLSKMALPIRYVPIAPKWLTHVVLTAKAILQHLLVSKVPLISSKLFPAAIHVGNRGGAGPKSDRVFMDWVINDHHSNRASPQDIGVRNMGMASKCIFSRNLQRGMSQIRKTAFSLKVIFFRHITSYVLPGESSFAPNQWQHQVIKINILKDYVQVKQYW